jgi:hypothetical protein
MRDRRSHEYAARAIRKLNKLVSFLTSPDFSSDRITSRWRGRLTGAEMVELVDSHGGNAELGWWDRVRPHSLGWVTARDAGGRLVGFVNVVSDGGTTPFSSTRRRKQEVGGSIPSPTMAQPSVSLVRRAEARACSASAVCRLAAVARRFAHGLQAAVVRPAYE